MTDFEDEDYAPGDVYEDVEGAPFRIGQWVQFVKSTDDTIDNIGIGRVGKVFAFLYSGLTGEQYPDDPFIRVSDLPHDLYWKEELRALTDEEIKKITEVSVPVEIEVLRPVKETFVESHFILSD